MDKQGEEHWPQLERFLRNRKAGGLVPLDLRSLAYLGYSYAKATIRRALQKRNAGDFGELSLFLVADQGPLFLDGLTAALREGGLFMLVAEAEDAVPDEGELFGSVPRHVEETFQVLRRKAPITTGELARLVGQTPQNTKNRLDRLYEMGLVQREKVPSPTGGLEWLNRVF